MICTLTMIRDKTLRELLDFLESNLENKVKLIVLGGNALVLLGFKQFTQDIDLCLVAKNKNLELLVRKFQESTNITVDIFYEGLLKTINVEDYLQRIIKVKEKYTKVDLYILDILDILLTKMDRMQARDWNDCWDTLKQANIKKDDLNKRKEYYIQHYIGSEEDKQRFNDNYQTFIKATSHFLK